MRRDWINENDDVCGALLRAMYRAARWLGAPENRHLASEILARSEHLNLPDHAIDPALNGELMPSARDPMWQLPNFLKFFDGATTFPWRSHGAWIGNQIAKSHDLDQAETQRKAAECFRTYIYHQHLLRVDADLPGASYKIEGSLAHPTVVASRRGKMILDPDAFFDGKTFDFYPKN